MPRTSKSKSMREDDEASDSDRPLNKKRKAPAESEPEPEGKKNFKRGDISKFLKQGAKGGKYPGWPKGPQAFRFANPSMVTLEVGNRASGRYTFRVHESILCGLDFFKAALQGSFLEATTKLIKMPEDDPVFMAPFVEFLYSKDYQEPVLTEIKGDGAHLKKRFTQKLYHAGVLVLGEKYGLEGLCAVAVSYMRSTSTKLEASSTTGDNANFLEYVVQLYNMSAPGSALRIPKTEDTRVTVLKPIAWDTRRAGRWIGSMWKDEVQRPLVKEAFERCPDLAQDLLIMISSGLGNNANSGAKPSCKGKTVSLEGQKIFF